MASNDLLPGREELIGLCDDGVVPEDQWRNRDTAGAQMQLARARALLKAGCRFEYDYEMMKRHKSVDETLWIEITYKGFDWFEGTLDPADPRPWDTDTFYIPTYARIEANAGRDWY